VINQQAQIGVTRNQWPRNQSAHAINRHTQSKWRSALYSYLITRFYQPRSAFPFGRRALLLLPRETQGGGQEGKSFLQNVFGLDLAVKFHSLRKTFFVHTITAYWFVR
jgi:hypothetical protein